MAKTKHLVYKMTTYSKYGEKQKKGHGYLDVEKNILFLGTGKYKVVNGKRREVFIPIDNQNKKFFPIKGKPDEFKGVNYNLVESFVEVKDERYKTSKGYEKVLSEQNQYIWFKFKNK